MTSGCTRKIETFDESGMGINDLFQLGFPDLSPFKACDISDVEWEGYRGSKSSGAPVLISKRDAT